MKNGKLLGLRFLPAFAFLLLIGFPAISQDSFRVLPYLQTYGVNGYQITWFCNTPMSSRIIIKDDSGNEVFNQTVTPEEIPEIYYTGQELNQAINGLKKGSWLETSQAFRYRLNANFSSNSVYYYTVSLGGTDFSSSFRTAPDKSDWESIRFIALSDSETEPLGRVKHRAWYPGIPLLRPFSIPPLWKTKFGTTLEQGIEIPNYFLTEKNGYAENLKVINNRRPDFIVMPGDLVQGGGYQPAWDEFFKHNAGEFDQGLTRYPIIPAIGNWETYGGINGGYSTNERGDFLPKLGRSRFHSYFETPISDVDQKHRQSYYRVDYGPITILTLDSSNGQPDQSRSDFPEQTRLKGREFSVAGTDTQENYTQAQYESFGGTDQSGFAPGSDQYAWLEKNLKNAQETKQLIFVQFHHIPFSSGEHGVPINHELATGQSGVPMRILHSLFEKHGVIAVLAGHDELFERSFVDEDGDGKGVLYYDVGVAGDGMRGVKRDWFRNPFQTLDYNQYSQWTADQMSPEIWNTGGVVPTLADGGKHYGHLEVNLSKIKEHGKTLAKIEFSPVYVFPVLDQNYDLIKVERRVYNDVVSVLVELEQEEEIPQIFGSATLHLDEAGQVSLRPEEVFQTWPFGDPEMYFKIEKSSFDCNDIGKNSVQVDVLKNSKTILQAEIAVNILDNLPPTIKLKNIQLDMDITSPAGVVVTPEMFLESSSDNCGLADISLDRTSFTCSDAGKSTELTLTATDRSGNKTTDKVQLSLNRVEQEQAKITGETTVCSGGQSVLTLSHSQSFEVISWMRDGKEIPGEKGKQLSVALPGVYSAEIRLSSGCTAQSNTLSLTVNALPEVKITGETMVCSGGESVLTLSHSQSFEVIKWMRDGKEIPGEKGKQLCVALPGVYSAEIRLSSGCTARSNTLSLIVNALPEGEIKVDGTVLTAPEGTFTYTWFRNGQVMNGETTSSIEVFEIGEYTVELTAEGGCSRRLDPVVLTISGIGPPWVVKPKVLKVYPNPAVDLAHMSLEESGEFIFKSLKIYSIGGHDVTTMVEIRQRGEAGFELEISRLATGTYQLILEGEKQQLFVGRLVKK